MQRNYCWAGTPVSHIAHSQPFTADQSDNIMPPAILAGADCHPGPLWARAHRGRSGSHRQADADETDLPAAHYWGSYGAG